VIVSLLVAAVVLLALQRKGPKAVWEGAVTGLIVGLIFLPIFPTRDTLIVAIAGGVFIGTAYGWIDKLSSARSLNRSNSN
jgi:hypothetical protein